MESGQPAPENSDQAVLVCTSEEQGQTQARSYECTFCKRGFTNAQALGGHMNIHRKDKAKLKQPPPNETQQFSDIKTTTTTTTTDQEKVKIVRNWISSAEDGASSKGETHAGELKNLPLFAENENQKPVNDRSAAAAPELDLELRLGHEPTRKFF